MTTLLAIVSDQTETVQSWHRAVVTALGYRALTHALEGSLQPWISSLPRPPGLILVDAEPEPTLLEEIRTFKARWPAMLWLWVLPFGQEQRMEALQQYGIDDYLCKPCSLPRIHTTIRNLLRWQALAASRPDTQMREDCSLQLLHQDGRLKSLEWIEREVIFWAVEHCQGRLSHAARMLGIGRSTLYRKLQHQQVAADVPELAAERV